MENFAAVVRVSQMGNRKVGSDSFHADEDQIGAIEAWGTANGRRIHVLPPELNVSGGLPIEKRPALLAAVEGVEQGVYDGIVVAYLSRLGRNVAEQLRTWSRVEAAGGKIVTIREGIDTSTASGRLHRNLLISIDAHEREQAGERWKERVRCSVEAGIWQRRQTPMGYLKGEDRRLAPDPARGPEVAAAFDEFLTGIYATDLAGRFKMCPNGFRRLLKNRVYLGELRVGEFVNTEAHEPLVDARTFDEVQRKFARNSRAPRATEHPSLLAGLVRCASCGHVMRRTGIRKRGGYNYICTRVHAGERCPQPAAISGRVLDEHVTAIARAELQRLQVEAGADKSMARAQRAVEDAETELDAYLDAVRVADVGADAFATGARSRRDAVEQAKDQLYAVLARSPRTPAGGSGVDAWDALTVVERNSLLHSLLTAAFVRPVARKGGVVPAAERTRVVAFGVGIELPRCLAGRAAGVIPIFPDADDVGVLSVPAGEDALETAGSAV